MYLVELIQKAEMEALKLRINANSILLNRDIKYCKDIFFASENHVTHYPPMILGLASYLTEGLPDDVAFALFENPEPPLTEVEEIKQQARKEIIEELKTMSLEDIIKMMGDTENE